MSMAETGTSNNLSDQSLARRNDLRAKLLAQKAAGKDLFSRAPVKINVERQDAGFKSIPVQVQPELEPEMEKTPINVSVAEPQKVEPEFTPEDVSWVATHQRPESRAEVQQLGRVEEAQKREGRLDSFFRSTLALIRGRKQDKEDDRREKAEWEAKRLELDRKSEEYELEKQKAEALTRQPELIKEDQMYQEILVKQQKIKTNMDKVDTGVWEKLHPGQTVEEVAKKEQMKKTREMKPLEINTFRAGGEVVSTTVASGTEEGQKISLKQPTKTESPENS